MCGLPDLGPDLPRFGALPPAAGAATRPARPALDRIFADMGGPAAVGRVIGVSTEHAAAMRRRGSIPVVYWPKLQAAARAGGIEVVSLGALVMAHAPADLLSADETIASSIIAKFGGILPMARALGHRSASTVQGWKERGTIPVRQAQPVRDAAAALGFEIDAADFLPDTSLAGWHHRAVVNAIGYARLAAALDLPPGTTSAWASRNAIPHQEWRRVAAVARGLGMDVTYDDLECAARPRRSRTSDADRRMSEYRS